MYCISAQKRDSIKANNNNKTHLWNKWTVCVCVHVCMFVCVSSCDTQDWNNGGWKFTICLFSINPNFWPVMWVILMTVYILSTGSNSLQLYISYMYINIVFDTVMRILRKWSLTLTDNYVGKPQRMSAWIPAHIKVIRFLKENIINCHKK